MTQPFVSNGISHTEDDMVMLSSLWAHVTWWQLSMLCHLSLICKHSARKGGNLIGF